VGEEAVAGTSAIGGEETVRARRRVGFWWGRRGIAFAGFVPGVSAPTEEPGPLLGFVFRHSHRV
jgi:hypothetical protein